MKTKSIKEGPERVFILILDQNEEAFKAITDFANRERLEGASVTAIGAFAKAELGWFDLAAKKYKPIEIHEQCEVLSLIGDIAQGDDGNASLHLHAVVGLKDGSVRGGHFLSGVVQPTLPNLAPSLPRPARYSQTISPFLSGSIAKPTPDFCPTTITSRPSGSLASAADAPKSASGP